MKLTEEQLANLEEGIRFDINYGERRDITKEIRIFLIETTNYCNFNCCFCPYEKMKRKKGTMDFKLFKKIIDEIKEWNIEDLSLTGIGEPLLDPKITEKVKYAREKMPKECIIEFNTNASLLTKEKFISLIEAGLDELRISAFTTNYENYKKIHGFNNFNKVKDNIKNLKEIKKSLGVKNPIISMGFFNFPESQETRNDWFRYWQPYMDKEDSWEAHNFSDGKNYKQVPKGKRFSCGRPFIMGDILWNGDVCICCADYEGKAVYGNVRNKSVKEIMLSLPYQSMLKIHKERKFELLPICDNCDQLIPNNLRNKITIKRIPYKIRHQILKILKWKHS